MNEMDGLHQRGKALEDEYFRRVDIALIEKMRSESEQNKRIKELIAATGLDDESLLEQLVKGGVNATNIAAFALTPLVFIAWADGSVDVSERQTVISASLRQGVNGNTLAFHLLEQWLINRPSRELWKLWKAYAGELHRALPPSTADKLANRLHRQCSDVANASGGLLGVGKICDAEQQILDEIAETLPERTPH